MTDIVERLRKPTDIEQFRDPAKLIGEMLAERIEAADEIERLRAALRIIADLHADDDGYHAVQMAREALGDD